MKKTNLLILSAVILLSSAGQVFAQTPEKLAVPTPSQKISTTSTPGLSLDNISVLTIKNAKVVSQNSGNFVLSFDIKNNTNAVEPEIRYALYLVNVTSATSSVIVDQKIYNDSFTVDASSTVSKSINYTIPKELPSGQYYFSLEVGKTSGLALTSNDFGITNYISGNDASVQILPSSCQYFISDKMNQKVDLFLSGDENVVAKCQVSSSYSQDVVMYPKFETRYSGVFGNIATTTGGSSDPITIKNGINNITLTIPRGIAPRDYFVTFYLGSSDGKILSSKRFHTYFVKGLAGSIESAEFDKPIYKAGDNLILTIYSFVYNNVGMNSPIATGTLSITIKNKSGALCADALTTTVSPAQVSGFLSTKVTNNCVNPLAHIVLSSKDENGNEIVLDTRDFGVITPAKYLTNYNLIYIVVIILVLFLAFITIFKLRKKKETAIFQAATLVMFFMLFVFGFARSASAIVCYPNPSDATAGAYNGYSGYFLCESTNDPVQGGNDGDFFWSGRSVSFSDYGNGGFLMWPKGNYNGGVYNVCDQNGDMCFKKAFSGGAGSFPVQFRSLSASSPVVLGGPVNISWRTAGASWCQLYQNGAYVGNFPPNNTATVNSINVKTVFDVTCGGWPAPVTWSTTVDPVPPTAQIYATSTSVSYGGSTNLSWNSTNSHFCIITKNSGTKVEDGITVSQGAKTAVAVAGVVGSSGSGTAHGQSIGVNIPIDVNIGSGVNIIDPGYSVNIDYNTASFISQFGLGNQPWSWNAVNPWGIDFDSLNNIYVTNGARIIKLDSSGSNPSAIVDFTQSGGNFSHGSQSSSGPNFYGIKVDSSNNIYVADAGNNTIVKFDTSGNVIPFTLGYNNGFVAVSRTAVDSTNNSGQTTYTYNGGAMTTTGEVSAPQNGVGFDSTPTSGSGNINWNSVTYGKGKFVAVSNTKVVTSRSNNQYKYAYKGGVMYSTDGVNWYSADGVNSDALDSNANDVTWNSVTYGNGVFVAVSNTKVVSSRVNSQYTYTYKGGVMYSSDGVYWHSADGVNSDALDSNANDVTWNSVTYGNGVFVAVSNTKVVSSRVNGQYTYTYKGGVMYSSDGVYWHSADGVNSDALDSNANDVTWNSVTFGNNKFIAVSNTKVVATSNHGQYTYAYKGGVMYSSDGVSWHSADGMNSDALDSNAKGSRWNSVTFGNNKFVAVSNTKVASTYSHGQYTYAYKGGVMYSSDGVSWQSADGVNSDALDSNANGVNWNSVTFGNNKFIAVSNTKVDTTYNNGQYTYAYKGGIMYSIDGISWQSADGMNSDALDSNASGVTWNSVVYGNAIVPSVFNAPEGVAIDSSGNIYVADTGNNRVVKFNSTGVYQSEFGGSTTTCSFKIGNTCMNSQTTSLINNPSALAIDSSNNLYVLDNSGVEVFNSSFARQYGITGSFNNASDVKVDSSSNIYVTNTNNRTVDKFNSTSHIGQFGSYGTGPGQFVTPTGLNIDSSGNIYVIDGSNNRVEKFLPYTVNTTYYAAGSTSTGPILEDTTFTATCIGNGGGSIATNSVTVHVKPGVTLKGPLSVNSGEAINLYWTSQGVNSCVASGDWSGAVPAESTGYLVSTVTPKGEEYSNARGFFITCTTPTGEYAQSSWYTYVGCPNGTSTPIKADLTPSVDCKTATINLAWSVADSQYVNLFLGSLDGTFIASTTGSSYNTTVALSTSPRNIVYYIQAINGDASTTAAVSFQIPSIGECEQDNIDNTPGQGDETLSCDSLQNNLSTTTIRLNQQMTWSAKLSSTTVSVKNTVWSGTNLPETITIGKPIELKKIYTTIGNKVIYATTTYTNNKWAVCSSTIRVVSGGGGGGEI